MGALKSYRLQVCVGCVSGGVRVVFVGPNYSVAGTNAGPFLLQRWREWTRHKNTIGGVLVPEEQVCCLLAFRTPVPSRYSSSTSNTIQTGPKASVRQNQHQSGRPLVEQQTVLIFEPGRGRGRDPDRDPRPNWKPRVVKA